MDITNLSITSLSGLTVETSQYCYIKSITIVYSNEDASPLASIAVDASGATTVFHVGDTFTHEGATVTATYEDASTKNVTADATFSTPDMTSAGTKTVNVSYTEGEVTEIDSYDITVNAPATLESLSLSGTYPTVFTQGDAFSSEGIVVTANYDDNTTADVTADATFSGYDMSTAGEQTVTVSYEDKTTTYDITVNAYVQPMNVTINMNYTWLGSGNGSNLNSNQLPVVKTEDNITITITDGTSTRPRGDSNYIRVYTGSTIKFEAPSGYCLAEIEFTTGGNNTWNAPTYDAGTLTGKTWTGEEVTEVTFTLSGSCFIASAAVTLAMPDTREETTIIFSQNILNLDLNGNASVTGDLTATLVDENYETINQSLTFVVSPNEGLTYNASTGKVTATAAGTYTITASYAGDENYKAADDEVCTVTVANSAVVTPPTFSISSGTAVSYGSTVAITADDGDDIIYTTDGTTPSYEDYVMESKGYAYSSPIEITTGVTIKAIAVKNSEHESAVVTATYTIAAPSAPTLSVAAGAVDEGTVVNVSDYNGNLVYFYTTDEETPTFDANLDATGTTQEYSDATGVTINEAMTLKMIAVDLGGNASEVTTAAYTIKEAASINLTEEIVVDDWASLSYDDESEYTTDGVTFTVTQCMKGGGGLQMKKNAGILVSPIVNSAHGYTVTITTTSSNSGGIVTLQIGSEEAVTVTNASNSVSATTSSTSSSFTIKNLSSNAAYIGSITITPTVIKNVATPVIALAAGTYEEVKSTTITCETTDATIYYTTDGTEPTDGSTEYTGAITIDESMTIKAIAYKNGESSYVASAAYVINLPLTTIAQVKALESGETFKLNLTGAQVVYIDNAKKNIYVRDASGAIDLYGGNSGFTTSLTTGDILSGTISGTYSPYKNLPEITNIADISVLTATSNQTVVAKVIDGTTAAIAANLCDLVKIENTEISESDSKYYVGENSDIQLYDNFSVGYTVTTGKAVDVSGIATVYNSTYELFPRYAEDIVYLETSEAVSISSAGYSTYCSDNDLDFTAVDAIKVFYATTDGSTLTFHRIYKVAAGTGVLLASAEGGAVAATNVPFFTGSADDATNNAFVRGTGTAVSYDASNNQYYYVLANVGGVVGFYQANNNPVATNRAYINAGGSLVKSFVIDLDDDPTSIQTIDNGQQTTDIIYNVAGQRIQKMQKGINIVNGKKILK